MSEILDYLLIMIYSFATHNTKAKENIDINGLHVYVGSKEFIKVIKLLRLQHKLENDITSNTINEFFVKSLQGDVDDSCRLDALEFANMLISCKVTLPKISL